VCFVPVVVLMTATTGCALPAVPTDLLHQRDASISPSTLPAPSLTRLTFVGSLTVSGAARVDGGAFGAEMVSPGGCTWPMSEAGGAKTLGLPTVEVDSGESMKVIVHVEVSAESGKGTVLNVAHDGSLEVSVLDYSGGMASQLYATRPESVARMSIAPDGSGNLVFSDVGPIGLPWRGGSLAGRMTWTCSATA